MWYYEELIKLGYKDSEMVDIHNVRILEGSIINADGYDSNLVEKYFHCVEFYEGQFGSDIYHDFEALATYHKIEVIGHCEDYRELYDTGGWNGNLGAVMKPKNDKDFDLANDVNFAVACMKTEEQNRVPLSNTVLQQINQRMVLIKNLREKGFIITKK